MNGVLKYKPDSEDG